MTARTPADLIALPQGGGAIGGLGEKFAPDPHTGTGNYSVPIELPPGRGGFTPELVLGYSTGNGTGPYGLGWSIGVPRVARRTAKGVPRYDGTDVFVLSGAEDLVPVEGGEYRPRTEGLFARIRRHRGGQDDYWVVRARDGLVSTYGTPGAAGADPAAVADPADGRKVFDWRLTSTVDPFGNRVEYDYTRFDGPQLYPAEIRYADDGAEFLVTVRFTYETRPDASADHRAGFAIRTTRRCARIEVITESPLRSYELRYGQAANGVSLLAAVEMTGHDGALAERLPPLEFGYTGFDPERRDLVVVGGADVSPARPGFELADLTGDGLPDVLELNGTARYWRNRGGVFDPPRSIPEAPAGLSLTDPGVRLLDADGDGRLDLMVSTPRLSGFYPMGFDGLFDRRSFRRHRQAPSVDLGDPKVRLVDLDGDGVTDALRADTHLECFFNDPDEGWTAARRGTGPQVSFADPRVRLADMSGDGLTDLVLVRNGAVAYWPSLGHGRFGERVQMLDPPRLPYGHDPRRVLIGDVDGDGLADLVYVDDGTVTVWINQSGGRWGEPIEIHGTPRVTDLDEVRLADLLGTGVAGVLWTADATAAGRPSMLFLDLTGGHKPYLLSEIDNNLGSVTRIGYAPSTRFRLADETDPRTRWRMPLPFPVQVVARAESVDAISGGRLTSEYSYHHGYWDGAEREFRGFGRVDRRDTEVIGGVHFSPPTETRTWFHQGVDRFHTAEYWPGDPAADPPGGHRALRGCVLRTELYGLDGSERADRPYTVTEISYGVREEAGGVHFPHQLTERTTRWERGDDPHTQVTVTTGYDPYGHPLGQIAVAVPRDGGPYLATHTVSTYAQRDDEALYLTGRPVRTTAYEIVNDGAQPLPALLADIAGGAVTRHVIAETLNFYDGEPYQGLVLGTLGEHGALTRAETLVLTEEILTSAYDGRPPCLTPGGAWTGDYPQDFRERTPPLAGYVLRDDPTPGYYAVTVRRRYDGRGLLTGARDALGRETTIGYDSHGLLPIEVTDPAGLTTRVVNDYRLLKPRESIDPNGNRRAVMFSPLGLVTAESVMGKPGEGDTPEAPGVRTTYDLSAFRQRGEPVSVRTVRRVHHATDTAIPGPERDETITSVVYLDGFGRELQIRAQAEDVLIDPALPADQSSPGGPVTGTPAERVVVSGRQVYDNKGRVVEKYEPYFDTGFAYVEDTEPRPRARMFYDPRGQLVRTIHPDGSEQRVVLGVPRDLTDPESYDPSPWETFTYDGNDNAGRTHPAAAQGYRTHWDTPSSVEVDALGRIIRSAVRGGGPEPIVTTTAYDIQGNVLTITDPLGRTAFQQVYDLLGRALRAENIDFGVRRTIVDAAGAVVEQRDGKGALILRAYDEVARPVRLWARDAANEPVTLRERTIYGDDADLSREEAVAANLLGRPYRLFDEAGLVTVDAYDFKGNAVEKTRQVIADEAILAVFAPPPPGWRVPAFRVDWETGKDLLDQRPYTTSSRYDALSRPVVVRCPEAVDGSRAEISPRYDKSGALAGLERDGSTVVERIAYDAHGQRVFVAYGNGVMTRYAYDPLTFRLSRLRSERFQRSADLTYQPSGAPLQDLGYSYDVAGNVLTIRDRTPGSGVSPSPDRLDRAFAYDPLYRVASATGRECDVPPPTPWDPGPRCVDITRARAYTEQYEYDANGNLVSLKHDSVRSFKLAPGGNRLAAMTTGATTIAHTYDPAGNLIREATNRHFEWDAQGRLRVFRDQTDQAEPTVHVHYLYDATGQRVKKLVRKHGRVEATVYVDDTFEHRRSGGIEHNVLHIMDGETRVAETRIGTPFDGDRTPAAKFHLVDHLGSSTVVLDDRAEVISREEFSPYGETTFGGHPVKRYRFTGKERDEESGLGYHGARYYAPWLCRWTSPDPAGRVDGPNLYSYVRGNPLRLADPSGRQADDQTCDPETMSCAEPVTWSEENVTPTGRGQSKTPILTVQPPVKKPADPSAAGIWGTLKGIFGPSKQQRVTDFDRRAREVKKVCEEYCEDIEAVLDTASALTKALTDSDIDPDLIMPLLDENAEALERKQRQAEECRAGLAELGQQIADAADLNDKTVGAALRDVRDQVLGLGSGDDPSAFRCEDLGQPITNPLPGTVDVRDPGTVPRVTVGTVPSAVTTVTVVTEVGLLTAATAMALRAWATVEAAAASVPLPMIIIDPDLFDRPARPGDVY